MANLRNVVKLLSKERDRLTKQVEGISAALSAFGAFYGNGAGKKTALAGAARKGTMSAAARARIGAAQSARWAKLKGTTGQTKSGAAPKRRTMSASARRKIAAAQRARWAKVKKAAK